MSLLANESTRWYKIQTFYYLFKIFLVNHPLCSSFILNSISSSSLNIPGMWVVVMQLSFLKIKFHSKCTTWSISIDLILPILFIAATADVYQCRLKCEYYQNYYTRLSIQIMQLWFLKCLCAAEIPQTRKVLYFAIPHPAKVAAVFSTIDRLGLRIGTKKSIILLSTSICLPYFLLKVS